MTSTTVPDTVKENVFGSTATTRPVHRTTPHRNYSYTSCTHPPSCETRTVKASEGGIKVRLEIYRLLFYALWRHHRTGGSYIVDLTEQLTQPKSWRGPQGNVFMVCHWDREFMVFLCTPPNTLPREEPPPVSSRRRLAVVYWKMRFINGARHFWRKPGRNRFNFNLECSVYPVFAEERGQRLVKHGFRRGRNKNKTTTHTHTLLRGETDVQFPVR